MPATATGRIQVRAQIQIRRDRDDLASAGRLVQAEPIDHGRPRGLLAQHTEATERRLELGALSHGLGILGLDEETAAFTIVAIAGLPAVLCAAVASFDLRHAVSVPEATTSLADVPAVFPDRYHR